MYYDVAEKVHEKQKKNGKNLNKFSYWLSNTIR